MKILIPLSRIVEFSRLKEELLFLKHVEFAAAPFCSHDSIYLRYADGVEVRYDIEDYDFEYSACDLEVIPPSYYNGFYV